MKTKLRYLKERWHILSGTQKVSIIFLGITLIALPLSVIMSFDPIQLFSRAGYPGYPVSPPYTSSPTPWHDASLQVVFPNSIYTGYDQFAIIIAERSTYRKIEYNLKIPANIIVYDTNIPGCTNGTGCVISGVISDENSEIREIRLYRGKAKYNGNYTLTMDYRSTQGNNTYSDSINWSFGIGSSPSSSPSYTSYPTASSTSYPIPTYTSYPTATGSAAPTMTSFPVPTYSSSPAPTVLPGNKLPSITTSLMPVAIKGRPYQVTFTAKDADGDKSYFTVDGIPGREAYPRACSTNVNSSGVATTKCTFYYIMDRSGRFRVSVKATDQKHGLDFALRNYTLLVVSRLLPSR